MLLLLITSLMVFSCSKDSDLLSEYVIVEEQSSIALKDRILDDSYYIQSQNSIVMNVLQNDAFNQGEQATVVDVQPSDLGTVVINEDNSLTYTPMVPVVETPQAPEEEFVDTFDYTVEVQDASGTTTQEQGTVTVSNLDNRTPTSGDNVFFVTTSGNSGNNGKSESSAWDIGHAFKSARPGDIVYIKAGNYGGGNYVFNQSGNASQPIKFIGYKNQPGDINAYEQNLLSNETRDRRGTTRFANNVEFDYTQSLNMNEMPHFTKNFVKNDFFFTVSGDYIEFHNIIIRGGDFGMLFDRNSSHCKLINSVIMEQGRMDIASSDSSHPDRYQGTGISNRRSERLEVRFCTFLNCEQQALEIRGANSGTYSDNVVYSYNDRNGTDYFYLVTGDAGASSHDLVIEYNRCHRLTSVPHGGHGFITKNGAYNNTFRNFRVINTNIETSFANATGNVFEKGYVQGSASQGDDLTYILTSNGSTGNTFKDIVVDDVWGGLLFLDHGEDGSSSFAGIANDYINIIVKNAKYGVIFSESGANRGPTNNNKFLNCTFFNTEFGIRAHRNNSGNSFINCHFSASSSLYTNHAGYSLNGNTRFENCHFSGNLNRNSANSFVTNNNIDGNPQFQDPQAISRGNDWVEGLRLLPSSPLQNAGQNISVMNPLGAFDFLGNQRNSYNIGAF